ncbi:MAG: DUF72 domain-containing protein [Saprospiraceae bacterium]
MLAWSALRMLIMEFGKLPDVDGVDFSLPPDPPANALLLDALGQDGVPAVFVGATGYNMRQWVGAWYPKGAKPADYLRHYGSQFNTIEHNTTHYRIPDEATVRRWYAETPADFRFCPKLPQSVSHSRDLGTNGGDLAAFCRAMALLEEKIGACFLQLPPHFGPERLPLLERFLALFPIEIPLAVEARHPAFFDPKNEAWFDVLARTGVGAVITDVAGRRDVCHMRLTSDKCLVRFVGNALHPSDGSRVREWARRMGSWLHEGLKEFYFFAHEPDNLLAPDLAALACAAFKATAPQARMRPAPQPRRPASLFDGL